MPLPSSGPISLSQVNVELGRSATATISMDESAVRTLFGKASGQISMSDGYGKANEFTFTISSNQTNANLRTLAVNAGWNQTSKVVATIASGVYISGNSTGTPALTINGSFPNGVTLTNNGFIVGMGGAGGRGREADLTDGTGGSAGGLALLAQVAVSINNVGTIAGGGGGGGGGGAGSYAEKTTVFSPGGGGGGGGRTGTTNSSGGAGGRSSSGGSPTTPYATAGGAGTSSSAGAGGPRANYSPGGYVGGAGGAGGSWGVAGATGVSGTTAFADSTSWAPRRFGLAGGSAGGSITGVSNITWIATGTRLGPII